MARLLYLVLLLMSFSVHAQMDSSLLFERPEYNKETFESISDSAKMVIFKNICWDNRFLATKKAFAYGFEALKLAKKLGNTVEQSTLLNFIGVLYRYRNNYPAAFDYFYKAQELSKKQGHLTELAYSILNIADIHRNEGDNRAAEKFILESLSHFEEANEKSGQVYCHNQLGIIDMENDKLTEALGHFETSLKLLKEINKPVRMGYVYSRVGEVHYEKKNYKKAKENYLKSISLLKGSYSRLALCNVYIDIGKYYFNFDSLAEAQYYFQKCYKVSEKQDFIGRNATAVFYLSQIFEKRGQIDSAYYYLKKHDYLADSLHRKETAVKIEKLEVQQEYEEKLRKKEQHAKQMVRKNQNYLIGLIGGAVVVLLIVAALYYIIHIKQKNNKQLAQKNNQILKQQDVLKQYSEDLKHSNKTKDKLFSIVAHDLRSPYTSLIGFTKMMLQNYDTMDDSEKLRILRLIHQSTTQTLEFIESLLLWSKAQSEEIKFDPEVFNLYDLAKSVCDFMYPEIMRKNNRVINNIDPSVKVKADIKMIEIVLRNLLSNANKYTSAGEITLTSESRDGALRVCVIDTGVGMEYSVLKKVMNDDYTTSTPGTEQEKGTGLGIGLCKEFIKKHGFELYAESIPTKGAKFCFYLQVV